jgi:hypothetical protein
VAHVDIVVERDVLGMEDEDARLEDDRVGTAAQLAARELAGPVGVRAGCDILRGCDAFVHDA